MPDNSSLINKVITNENFKFSDYTTFGLGGKAKIAYFPKTEQEAIAVYVFLKKDKSKFEILGKGSNVLASDKDYDGAVISTSELRGIEIIDNQLYCLSGTTVNELLKFCLKNNIGGYEYLAGIPASLGGLALMNGGIPSKHIGDDIVSVNIYNGETRTLTNKNCAFGNKNSIMRDINAIILSIMLPIRKDYNVKDKIRTALKLRSGQPKGRTCGCVFKNPSGMSAGKLIDEAGLKGLRIGNAEVSNLHANFIVNKGSNAYDVYALISEIKKKVFEYSHVLLEEEVVYIGEFNDFNG